MTRPVVIITGMSGAGRTTALRALEDSGYEAVDNMPLYLLDALLQQEELRDQPLAIAVDSRTRDFSAARLSETLTTLRRQNDLAVTCVFIDCEGAVLQRRFTETRRRHPLALDRPVVDGIRAERALLAPVLPDVDLRVDTTDLPAHDLRRILMGHLDLRTSPGLRITVMSFSFRKGVPREADLVFDVRFLRNPHYDRTLRPQTGRDTGVAAFITEDPHFTPFWDGLTGLLNPILPRYLHEGKTYLTIAVGCTGGRHRSVLVAEHLQAWLLEKTYTSTLLHRELEG